LKNSSQNQTPPTTTGANEKKDEKNYDLVPDIPQTNEKDNKSNDKAPDSVSKAESVLDIFEFLRSSQQSSPNTVKSSSVPRIPCSDFIDVLSDLFSGSVHSPSWSGTWTLVLIRMSQHSPLLQLLLRAIALSYNLHFCLTTTPTSLPYSQHDEKVGYNTSSKFNIFFKELYSFVDNLPFNAIPPQYVQHNHTSFNLHNSSSTSQHNTNSLTLWQIIDNGKLGSIGSPQALSVCIPNQKSGTSFLFFNFIFYHFRNNKWLCCGCAISAQLFSSSSYKFVGHKH
jgi:hypothetical protein